MTAPPFRSSDPNSGFFLPLGKSGIGRSLRLENNHGAGVIFRWPSAPSGRFDEEGERLPEVVPDIRHGSWSLTSRAGASGYLNLGSPGTRGSKSTLVPGLAPLAYSGFTSGFAPRPFEGALGRFVRPAASRREIGALPLFI